MTSTAVYVSWSCVMPLKMQLRVYPHPDESCPVAGSQNICQHPQVSHRQCNPHHRKLLFLQSILTLEKRERESERARARLSLETLHFTAQTSLQPSSMNCPIVPLQPFVNCPPNTASSIWLSMNCSYSKLCLFVSINSKNISDVLGISSQREKRTDLPLRPAHERTAPLLRENKELPNRWSTDNDDINFPGFLLNAPSNDGESWGTFPIFSRRRERETGWRPKRGRGIMVPLEATQVEGHSHCKCRS